MDIVYKILHFIIRVITVSSGNSLFINYVTSYEYNKIFSNTIKDLYYGVFEQKIKGNFKECNV